MAQPKNVNQQMRSTTERLDTNSLTEANTDALILFPALVIFGLYPGAGCAAHTSRQYRASCEASLSVTTCVATAAGVRFINYQFTQCRVEHWTLGPKVSHIHVHG